MHVSHGTDVLATVVGTFSAGKESPDVAVASAMNIAGRGSATGPFTASTEGRPNETQGSKETKKQWPLLRVTRPDTPLLTVAGALRARCPCRIDWYVLFLSLGLR